MQTLNLSELLATLGRTSFQAGVLVLLVLFAQWLFRKQLTPRWRCALWFVVVARLLLPVSLTSATSVFNLLPSAASRVEVLSTMQELGRAQVELEPLPELLQPEPPATMVSQTDGLGGIVPEGYEATNVTSPSRPVDVNVQRSAPARTGSVFRHLAWPWFLFALWFGGAALLATHVIATSRRLARRFVQAPLLEDPAVLAVLEDCRRRPGGAETLACG